MHNWQICIISVSFAVSYSHVVKLWPIKFELKSVATKSFLGKFVKVAMFSWQHFVLFSSSLSSLDHGNNIRLNVKGLVFLGEDDEVLKYLELKRQDQFCMLKNSNSSNCEDA